MHPLQLLLIPSRSLISDIYQPVGGGSLDGLLDGQVRESHRTGRASDRGLNRLVIGQCPVVGMVGSLAEVDAASGGRVLDRLLGGVV